MDQAKPIYRGRKQNQRDPAAILPANTLEAIDQAQVVVQPRQQAVQQPVTQLGPSQKKRVGPPPPRKVPLMINKPSRLASHQGMDILPQNEDPSKNAIFAGGMSSREVNNNTLFTPSTPAAIELSRAAYKEMMADDFAIQKVLLPEYYDYYATAMIWFRMITLKPKLRQGITPVERDLLLFLDRLEYAIPEQLLSQLKVIGSIQTITREHLFPAIPDLPTHIVGEHGGYYGPINTNTHNLYEEIPCLGVLAEAVRQSVSSAPPGPYVSSLAADRVTPNDNLLGFRPLDARRAEAKNLAFESNITAARFPEFPPASGVNLDLLAKISDYLAQSKSFKVTSLNLNTLPKCGSQVQAMIQRITDPTPHILEKDQEIVATSLINENVSTFGASIYFIPQLWKSHDTIATASSWACIDQPPQAFIDNRNERRETLPVQYRQEVFRSISQNGRQYRGLMTRQMVLTKR